MGRGSTVFDNGVSKEQGYLVPIIQSYTEHNLLYNFQNENVYSTYRYTCVSLRQRVGGGMGVSLSLFLGQTSLGQT